MSSPILWIHLSGRGCFFHRFCVCSASASVWAIGGSVGTSDTFARGSDNVPTPDLVTVWKFNNGSVDVVDPRTFSRRCLKGESNFDIFDFVQSQSCSKGFCQFVATHQINSFCHTAHTRLHWISTDIHTVAPPTHHRMHNNNTTTSSTRSNQQTPASQHQHIYACASIHQQPSTDQHVPHSTGQRQDISMHSHEHSHITSIH
jgi:hypothetical protein